MRMREGFALAAAAHADRGAALAMAGLSDDDASEATELARELSARDRAARRDWLHALLAAAPPPLRGAARRVPPRALALLARSAAPDVGRRWLAAAPMPRAGYVPDGELLSVLRKLAARESSPG